MHVLVQNIKIDRFGINELLTSEDGELQID